MHLIVSRRDVTYHGHTVHTDHGTTWWTAPAGHTYPVEPELVGAIVARPPDPPDPSATRNAPEPPPF